MAKAYVVMKAGFEYNDESYRKTQDATGTPLKIFTGPDAQSNAQAHINQLITKKYGTKKYTDMYCEGGEYDEDREDDYPCWPVSELYDIVEVEIE